MGKPSDSLKIRDRIISKAIELGASIAGVASVSELKISPSHMLYPEVGGNHGVGTREASGSSANSIAWPSNAISALVIGLAHPPTLPELDWWDGIKGTQGNRALIELNKKISAWIEAECKIRTHQLPYHVERGGVFLKDSAVNAGLGVVGLNNLFLSNEYGPHVRLRVMLLDAELPTTKTNNLIDPCSGCSVPCRKACPQNAFGRHCEFPTDIGVSLLPGRDGNFVRSVCNIQMEKDIKSAETSKKNDGQVLIRYCRECELVCPAGGYGHLQ